jgi:3-hydroxyacyl-[acyl-carrier-protein] dehydratase
VVHSTGFSRNKRIVYFMTIEKARFRKPVTPGQLLRMPVRALRRRGPVWRFEGKAFTEGALCAEAEFSAMIHDSAEES